MLVPWIKKVGSRRLSTLLPVANTALVLLIFAVISIYSSIFQLSLIGFGLFLAFTFAFVLLPGSLATSALSLSGFPLKSKFILANALGLSGLCYFSWLLNAKFRLPYYSGIYLIVALSSFYVVSSLTKSRSKIAQGLCRQNGLLKLLHSSEFTAVLLIALLAILASNGLVKNAVVQDGSYCFYGTAGLDGIWHLGNVAYLKKDFDFADIHQNRFDYGYHIFVYLFAALASNLLDLNTATVLFKYLPIYLLFFLLYSGYVAGSSIFGSRLIGMTSAFLVLFMDDGVISVKLAQVFNSSWMEYLYFGPKLTSAYLNSPSYNAALITFFPLLLLFGNGSPRVKLDRASISSILVAGFLIGAMVGFKASTFSILGLSLMVLAAIEVFKYRNAFFTLVGFTALLVSLPFLTELLWLPNENFRFNPGYFPFQSAIGRDLLALSGAPVYQHGIVLVIVIIYLVAELGPRLLSLKFIAVDWRRPLGGVSLMWLCAIFGIGLTLLFTPSSDAYNAMYFHRFGCACLAFLMGRTLIALVGRKSWPAILVTTICLFYVAGGFYTFFRLRAEATLRVPQDKIAGLQTLANLQKRNSKVILGNRFSYEEGSSHENIFYLYSAFSENTVLSEGERYSVIRFADSLRLKQVRDDISLFYATDDHQAARTILEKWSVDYVIVDLEYDQKLHFDASFLEQVHASKSLIIYAFRREAERS